MINIININHLNSTNINTNIDHLNLHTVESTSDFG